MRRRGRYEEGDPIAVLLGIVAFVILTPITSGRVSGSDAVKNALIGFGIGAAVIAVILLVVPRLRIPRSVNAARARAALEWTEGYGAKAIGDTVATMTRRGYPGRIEFVGGLKPETVVTFAIEGATDGHVIVTRESLGQQFLRSAGIADFEIGDRAFDDAYCVRTSDEKSARAVVTPAVCNAMMVLEKYFHATLLVTPTLLALSARGLRYDRGEIEALMTAAVRIFDSLRLPERESVLVVSATQSIGEATCKVCGTAMASGAVVRCAKCATPHHRDCWQFNGRCAVFACGESKMRG